MNAPRGALPETNTVRRAMKIYNDGRDRHGIPPQPGVLDEMQRVLAHCLIRDEEVATELAELTPPQVRRARDTWEHLVSVRGVERTWVIGVYPVPLVDATAPKGWSFQRRVCICAGHRGGQIVPLKGEPTPERWAKAEQMIRDAFGDVPILREGRVGL